MYEQTVGTHTSDEIDEVIVIEEAGVDPPDEELDDGSLVKGLREENTELKEALRTYTLVVELAQQQNNDVIQKVMNIGLIELVSNMIWDIEEKEKEEEEEKQMRRRRMMEEEEQEHPALDPLIFDTDLVDF